ncbi:hypothetical protein OAP18_01175 [Gammaproteobacteria bacterium]|nr:hypothetical protein [Gammaproteobacteria bacterium]MDC0598444.1 hypothetical protein [Gammaproteobacteria bacterium]
MTGKTPFFGWLVLSGLFLNYMAVVGILIYTLPLLYPFLISEYGWSTGEVTRAVTIGYFTGAVLTPLVSPFYDKYSIRKFMVVGIITMVLGLFLFLSLNLFNVAALN